MNCRQPADLRSGCWNVTANVLLPLVGDLAVRRICIENVYPAVDCGRFAVKRLAAEPVEIWADIFSHGHTVLAAELLWRPEAGNRWFRVPMRLHENDRWTAAFTPKKPGRYLYAIEAWTNEFGTWRRDLIKKRDAGLDISVEVQEGLQLP